MFAYIFSLKKEEVYWRKKIEVVQKLIQIKTINGDEHKVAQYVKDLFEGELELKMTQNSQPVMTDSTSLFQPSNGPAGTNLKGGNENGIR